MMCSNSLQQIEVREIGQQLVGLLLLPFLNNGVTNVVFQSKKVIFHPDCLRELSHELAPSLTLIFRASIHQSSIRPHSLKRINFLQQLYNTCNKYDIHDWGIWSHGLYTSRP